MATKQKDYNDMTVEELRAEVGKREIEGRSNLTTKDDLIKALNTDDTPAEKRGRAGETTDNPPQFPMAGMKIEGQENQGKEETRLFQTAPDTKTWLTKAQAQEKGFYWKD